MDAKGFTLIELMAAVAILGIVFFAAVPGIGHLYAKQGASTATNSIVGALALARDHAVHSQVNVSICPSSDGMNCAGSWGRFVVVFRDKLGNGVLVGPEDILHSFSLGRDWRTRWRAFGHRPHLTLDPRGFTKHQNGSFYLCRDGRWPTGRLIVVNKAGRSRLAEDSDQNNFAERSDGEDMSCN